MRRSRDRRGVFKHPPAGGRKSRGPAGRGLKHLQVRLGVHWTLEPVHWEAPAIDYAIPRHHLFTVSVLARCDLVGVGRTPDDFVFPVRRRRQNEPLLIRPEHPLEPVFCMLQPEPAGLKPRCLVRGCQGWSQMGRYGLQRRFRRRIFQTFPVAIFSC